VFTLTSLAERSALARLRVLAVDAVAQPWLAIPGGDAAEFAAGETRQVAVTISPQRAGRFAFHLEARSAEADGESTIGPAVELVVTEASAPASAHRRFPWLLVAILAVLGVAAGGVGLWLVLRAPSGAAAPTAATDVVARQSSVTAAERAEAERQARAWFEAMRRQDLDQLVAMSPPPFRFDRAIAKDAAEVRRRYQAMATPASRALFARLVVVGVQVRAAAGADAPGLVAELALRAGSDDDAITLSFHDRPALRLSGFSQ
jgi:hypothetical protein